MKRRFLWCCRYIRNGHKRPARLPYSFYKWIPIVYRYTQEEVIELAGMDAAMYLRILMFGGLPLPLLKFMSHRICCFQAQQMVASVTTSCMFDNTGAELFFFLTIWCLIVVLPTNLSVSFMTDVLHAGKSAVCCTTIKGAMKPAIERLHITAGNQVSASLQLMLSWHCTCDRWSAFDMNC